MRLFKFLIFTAVLFVASESASAFTISPLRYVLTIDPGGKQSVSVEIINEEQHTQAYSVFVQGIKRDEKGTALYQSGVDAAENWVSPKNLSFELAPGARKKVDFEFSVPVSYEPGSHTVALIVKALSVNQSSIGLTGSAALPISLTVGGRVIEELKIQAWQPEKKVYLSKPWNFNLVLRNTGSVSVKGEAVATIYNWRGKIAEEKFSIGNEIFPKTNRSLKSSFSNSSNFPGKYKVNVSIPYGFGSAVSEAATFWYFPYWLVGTVIFILVISFWVFLKNRDPRL